MKENLRKMVILYTTTSVHSLVSSEQGGRRNRALLDKFHTNCKNVGIPNKFWREAVGHTDYLYNRKIFQVINNLSSYEISLGYPPTIHNSETFGCEFYTHTDRLNRK